MDFSPMNMRMVVPQSTEVGHLQHNMNQQSALQQDYKAMLQRQLSERQQSQVRKKDEAEGEKIKNDDKQRQHGGQRKTKQKKSPKEILEEQEEAVEEPAMAVDQFRGRTIDISL